MHTHTYLWNVNQFATTVISIAYLIIPSCERFRQEILIVINNCDILIINEAVNLYFILLWAL